MGSPQEPAEPVQRFIADAMLGRLARWLRILGYDTAYEKTITDKALVERAVQDQRRLLTRDRRLAIRKLLRGRHTLIISDHLDEQLRQLRDELHLPLALWMDRGYRCAVCKPTVGDDPTRRGHLQSISSRGRAASSIHAVPVLWPCVLTGHALGQHHATADATCKGTSGSARRRGRDSTMKLLW